MGEAPLHSVGDRQAAVPDPAAVGRVRPGRRNHLDMLEDLRHRLEVVRRADGELLHERNRDAVAPHFLGVFQHGGHVARGGADDGLDTIAVPAE